jgi:hypothetical protein
MEMTYTQTDKAGPLWAVFGAPLVGVPLMVVLLAIGSGTTVDAAVETDVGFAVEQVDLPELADEMDGESPRRD